MTFREAVTKSWQRRIAGIVLSGIAILSTLVSFLRMFYFRIDDGTPIGGALAQPFKQIVTLIYENTRFLDWFWAHSPTPDLRTLKDPENVYFAAIYLTIFVGFALHASGTKLAIRLGEIDKQIEDQLIRESIEGGPPRTRKEIESGAVVPTQSIFSQFHQLYLAPVVTAIVGGVILKWLGF